MASSSNFPLVPSGGRFASERIARTLKALRLKRGLRPGEMAERLGIARRSYEHFEAGGGRPNLERIGLFAAATDSDAFAILAGIAIQSPEFAVRCSDNKLMLILTLALMDFDARVGDDIARLESATIMTIFTRAFAQLAVEARRRRDFLDDWLGRRGAPPEGEDTGKNEDRAKDKDADDEEDPEQD